MATGGSSERPALTLLWRIENIGLWEKKQVFSHINSCVLTPRSLEGKRFCMYLDPKYLIKEDEYVMFYLWSEPLGFPIDCEWSLIRSNGLPLVEGTLKNQVVEKNKLLYLPCSTTYEEAFLTNKSVFVKQDSITVQCRIWKSSGNLATDEFISCRSRLGVIYNNFLWSVSGFSALKLNQEVTTPVTFEMPNGSNNFQMQLSLKGVSLEEASISVEFIAISIFKRSTILFKVSVLNNEQKVVKCLENGPILFDLRNKDACILPKFVFRKELLSKKSDCLRNDILGISCEFTAFSSTCASEEKYCGCSILKMDVLSYSSSTTDASCQVSQQTVQPSNIYFEETDSLTLLATDFLSLYKDRNLADFELRSGDVSFPVHKAVLSARSPVFRIMFSAEENQSDSLSLDDVDAETLDLLLTFMYTGTVELQGQWDSTLKLNYAADKYQVQSLKQKCSSILRSDVSVSNVSDVLTLADRYQDSELTSFVHGFALNSFDEIMQSKEWETFQNKDPALAGRTMHELYKKKLENKHLEKNTAQVFGGIIAHSKKLLEYTKKLSSSDLIIICFLLLVYLTYGWLFTIRVGTNEDNTAYICALA